VVRKFVEEEGFRSESFLRVHISEENFAKFFSSELNPVVEGRIKSAILSGIDVNGTVYQFLAYSSSQLKEFSLWMVAPEKGWTTEAMRASMGDFSECRTPYEYSARIGQCFSTTFQGLAGQDKKLVESIQPTLKHSVVKDIPAAGTMTHSDGCGVISKGSLSMLLEMLPHGTKTVLENTSGVQIRYGGAKGFLVSWERDVIDKVVGEENSFQDVLLRKSMVKFKADYNFLEICR
jgi:RNA-dependent RNA polymerase